MIFNTSDPINAILLLIATLLLMYLGKETKKSAIPLITLAVEVAVLIMHTYQFLTYAGTVDSSIMQILGRCIALDFGLVIVAFLSYLWVDEIESKVKHKKVVSTSLDWFWKEV